MLRRENDCAGACGPDPRSAVQRVARLMPDAHYIRPRCFFRARQVRRMDELQTAFAGTQVGDVAEEADAQNRIRDHLNPCLLYTSQFALRCRLR